MDLPLYNCSVTALSVLSPHEARGRALREAGLEQTRQRLEQGEICACTLLKVGNVAEVILQVAEELCPHLVVLGATGLTHAFGVPLGGVVEKVVEQIHRPVLVYRQPYRGCGRSVSLQMDLLRLKALRSTSASFRYPMKPKFTLSM